MSEGGDNGSKAKTIANSKEDKNKQKYIQTIYKGQVAIFDFEAKRNANFFYRFRDLGSSCTVCILYVYPFSLNFSLTCKQQNQQQQKKSEFGYSVDFVE
ncbi:hypothetical protein P8452_52752 [Trifolium repens]|nr:hypothetical protein P8452_52752 [Trifolium repens]